ncbi:MAG: DUF885 domain-containing protein [Armatimonadetes bacterium]|nr:DUF885 domain-containing protein [Armatimonadota bacterium]
MNRKSIPILLFLLLAIAPAHAQTDPFEALLAEEWEESLRRDPVSASYLGEPRYNHLWPDLSAAALEKDYQQDRRFLERLQAIEPSAFSGQRRTSYELFFKQLQWRLRAYELGLHLVPLNQREGIQHRYQLAENLSFDTEDDYRDWIARLESFPAHMDQTLELMRQGIRRGVLHPRVIVERLPRQAEIQIVTEAEQSPYFDPFEKFPESFSATLRTELAAAGRQAVLERVVPAHRKLAEFLRQEYLPASPEQPGWVHLPGGPERYAFLVERFTTTSLTPEEIHEIGLGEVARIRRLMEEIVREVGFKGSFSEFLTFLREDSRFYYQDPDELLKSYRALAKQIDLQLVRLFRTLPRMPYGVEPIPEEVAPDTTTAYYMPPAADGSRAGIYYVNLYRPESRPRYEMEVLSLHEAVPGHHLQIALAMELEDLPPFRRYGEGYTAFVEGWALYAESLGGDLGLYRDPYSRFGRLTYEMWRAVRLVVDTGIHHKGWSRDQAVRFFLENTAKSKLDIDNEVDRYIAWPGQALAYKIGELRIRQLRREAEKALGERFDLREFHQVVLGSGAVPLDVLESNVRSWLAARR